MFIFSSEWQGGVKNVIEKFGERERMNEYGSA